MHSGFAVFPWIIAIVTIALFGLIFVAGVVGLILFLANKPGSGVRRVGGSLAVVCGGLWLIPIVMAMALVSVRTSAVRMESQEQQLREQKISELKRMGHELHEQHQIPQIAPPKVETIQTFPPATVPGNQDAGLQRLPDESERPAASASDSASSSQPVGQDDRTAAATSAGGVKPAWTNVAETKSGEVTYRVLSSGQYSTIDEARRELAGQARAQLDGDFREIFHTPRGSVPELPVEELRRLAIKQEYVESVDRDFGNFFAPMHRVWWQLELSPEVRTNLHPLWKSQVQASRTITVAGVVVAAILGLAGWSLFSRRRPAVMG